MFIILESDSAFQITGENYFAGEASATGSILQIGTGRHKCNHSFSEIIKQISNRKRDRSLGAFFSWFFLRQFFKFKKKYSVLCIKLCYLESSHVKLLA